MAVEEDIEIDGCGGGYRDRLGFGNEEENGSGKGKKSLGIASEWTYFLRKEESLLIYQTLCGIPSQVQMKWRKEFEKLANHVG